MAYRNRSTRRIAKKTKSKIYSTIIISLVLLYFGLTWLIPNLIAGVGFLNQKIKPTSQVSSGPINSTLAPPVLNIPYEATNSSQINILGYASSDSKVDIYLNDDLKATIKAGDDGSFTAPNINLSLGLNNIYGKTIDEKNNKSLASKTITLTLDTEKPSLTVSSPDDNKVIQGGDKKVIISGQTEADATVTINGNQIILNSDGNFSSTQSLNDGDNNFTIRSTDSASNYTEITRKVTHQP
jgi:hypothetical protein